MCPQPPVLRSTSWICASLPIRSRTFQLLESSVSLFGPVAVRTTSPSTRRLTAVSIERGNPGWSANTNWPALMCPRGALIGDLDPGRPALELGHAPVRPVERLAVLPGAGAQDLAVDHEVHRRRRVGRGARVGMVSAAHQEVDVVGGDLELRRDDRARAVSVVDERVEQLTALVAADRLLVTDRPGRRPRAVQPGP
jgi:hypothetical protein